MNYVAELCWTVLRLCARLPKHDLYREETLVWIQQHRLDLQKAIGAEAPTPPGVDFHGGKSWRARTSVNGRQVYLGMFDNVHDAQQAIVKVSRIDGRFLFWQHE